MKKQSASASKAVPPRISSKILLKAMLKNSAELEAYAKLNYGTRSFEQAVSALLSGICLYLERRRKKQ